MLVLITQDDFFGLNVSFEDAHDVLDAVGTTLEVEEVGHLAFLDELGVNELDVTLVVDDVAILVDEPAGSIYWSPISIHLVPIDILQYHGLLIVIILKVAEALVRIEVKSLHSVWQRQLVFVIRALHANQVLILKNDLKTIFGDDVARIRIDQVAFLVDGHAVQILELHRCKSTLLVDYFASPVTLELAHDVVLVESTYVDHVVLLVEPRLNVIDLGLFMQSFCFGIPFEEL